MGLRTSKPAKIIISDGNIKYNLSIPRIFIGGEFSLNKTGLFLAPKNDSIDVTIDTLGTEELTTIDNKILFVKTGEGSRDFMKFLERQVK